MNTFFLENNSTKSTITSVFPITEASDYGLMESALQAEIEWNNIMIEAIQSEYKYVVNESLQGIKDTIKKVFHKFIEWLKNIKSRFLNLINKIITKIKSIFKKQKEDMWNLIAKAEEKLKHENRKKVQVKLMLDQMVLRGISALNLQAMSLSQNSLKDVVKCDYHKEIDKKYNTMLFPDTKSTMKTKFK